MLPTSWYFHVFQLLNVEIIFFLLSLFSYNFHLFFPLYFRIWSCRPWKVLLLINVIIFLLTIIIKVEDPSTDHEVLVQINLHRSQHKLYWRIKTGPTDLSLGNALAIEEHSLSAASSTHGGLLYSFNSRSYVGWCLPHLGNWGSYIFGSTNKEFNSS